MLADWNNEDGVRETSVKVANGYDEHETVDVYKNGLSGQYCAY